MNPSRHLVVLGVSLAAVSSMVSCTTLTKHAVGEAVQAVTGTDPDLSDSGEPALNTDAPLQGALDASDRVTAAVYEVGPTPGWELGFREHAFVEAAHYQNRICLNSPLEFDLGTLWSRQLPDPFFPSDHLDRPLFVQENSLGIDPGYVRLGEVRMGGPSPTTTIWRSAAMLGPYGPAEGACPRFGSVLFGPPRTPTPILR